MAIGGREFKLNENYFPPCLRIDILSCSPDPKVKECHKVSGVLIDTGSDLTILPNKIIKKLKLKMISIKEIENFNGEIIEVKLYLANIVINDIVQGLFEIGGVDSEALIGMDLIKDWHILINCPNGTFEIANNSNYKIPVSIK